MFFVFLISFVVICLSWYIVRDESHLMLNVNCQLSWFKVFCSIFISYVVTFKSNLLFSSLFLFWVKPNFPKSKAQVPISHVSHLPKLFSTYFLCTNHPLTAHNPTCMSLCQPCRLPFACKKKKSLSRPLTWWLLPQPPYTTPMATLLSEDSTCKKREDGTSLGGHI